MNKTKMILMGTGGAIGIAVLVTAYFAWAAFSAKTAAIEGDDEEGTDGLETVVSKAQTLSKKPIYPCAASLTALESNRTVVADWQKEAMALAARGDRAFAKTTPAAFKTFIVADAKRLAALPGAVGGVLMKPDFAFGPFRDYIIEGKMPAEAQLAELQRKWDDVVTVVEVLAANGICELVDVGFAAAKGDEAEKAGAEKNKKAKKPVRKAAQAPQASQASHSYVFTFTTKPAGFVKALNALMVCERFVTVDSFTFSRSKDALSQALGGTEEKKAEARPSGRRGRRRAAAVVEEEKKPEDKGLDMIVTDPLLDEPIRVVLTATVSDFRSLEEGGVSADEEKKGARK